MLQKNTIYIAQKRLKTVSLFDFPFMKAKDLGAGFENKEFGILIFYSNTKKIRSPNFLFLSPVRVVQESPQVLSHLKSQIPFSDY